MFRNKQKLKQIFMNTIFSTIPNSFDT